MANTPSLAPTRPTSSSLESWMPYRRVFDVVWSGRRHMMMMASQVDRFGNQNISAIGDWARPKAQLIGVRGAPGNTINHTTSYWVPNHSTRSFVEHVDMVCGVGYDRAAAAGPSATPVPRDPAWSCRIWACSTSTRPTTPCGSARCTPGVAVDEVVERHRLRAGRPDDVPDHPHCPRAEELELIREVLDPRGCGTRDPAERPGP